MPDYLEKRRQLWYAKLTVPKDLQSNFGLRFVKSTGTGDRRKAVVIASQIVAGWKLQIEQARGNEAYALSKAIQFRNEIEKIQDTEHRKALEHTLLDSLDKGDSFITEADKDYYSVAMGHKTLSEPYFNQWKVQLNISPRTIEQYAKDAKLFIAKFPLIEGVNKRAIALWLDDISSQGVTKETQKRIVKACRSLWKYMIRYSSDSLPEDPFHQVISAEKGKKKPPREPFEPHEVVELWAAAKEKNDYVLADAIVIAAYSGCRIDELCSIFVKKASIEVFNIEDSKTVAGIRTVPVHSQIQPVVKRLIDNAEDEYLLSSLSVDKFGNRSNSLAKRFSNLKTKLGHGGRKVFHSLRHALVTALVNAGVMEYHIADIVGHEKKGITGNVYAKAINIEVKRVAIEKVNYPFPELK